MKKILTIGITALMIAGLTACAKPAADNAADTSAQAASAESAAEESKAEETKAEQAADESGTADGDGVLTVGFDQDFPPMGFVGADGQFTGFDIELAAEAAKRMGMEVAYQPIAWDAKDMELESGTIDCIWNGFTMNGREDGYTWSKPYMDNTQVFVVRKDANIAALSDLEGKTVEVQADSSAEAALADMPELTGSFANLLTTPDYNTAFMDLDMGAVDAIAMDIIVAGYQIEQRGDDAFVILDESIASEQYGIGFKKGNEELRDKVDAALEEMAADGTLAEISTKWFSKDITTTGK